MILISSTATGYSACNPKIGIPPGHFASSSFPPLQIRHQSRAEFAMRRDPHKAEASLPRNFAQFPVANIREALVAKPSTH